MNVFISSTFLDLQDYRRAREIFADTAQPAKAAPSLHVVPNPEPYFTGREQDLQKLRDLLSKDRAFVCIENAPGIGKSQMSLKAAAAMHDLFFVSMLIPGNIQE